MEKNTQKHIERENLLKYFVDSYESAYFVNLKDVDNHIHPDDRELMRKIIDKEYIRSKLKNEESQVYTIR